MPPKGPRRDSRGRFAKIPAKKSASLELDGPALELDGPALECVLSYLLASAPCYAILQILEDTLLVESLRFSIASATSKSWRAACLSACDVVPQPWLHNLKCLTDPFIYEGVATLACGRVVRGGDDTAKSKKKIEFSNVCGRSSVGENVRALEADENAWLSVGGRRRAVQCYASDTGQFVNCRIVGALLWALQSSETRVFVRMHYETNGGDSECASFLGYRGALVFVRNSLHFTNLEKARAAGAPTSPEPTSISLHANESTRPVRAWMLKQGPYVNWGTSMKGPLRNFNAPWGSYAWVIWPGNRVSVDKFVWEDVEMAALQAKDGDLPVFRPRVSLRLFKGSMVVENDVLYVESLRCRRFSEQLHRKPDQTKSQLKRLLVHFAPVICVLVKRLERDTRGYDAIADEAVESRPVQEAIRSANPKLKMMNFVFVLPAFENVKAIQELFSYNLLWRYKTATPALSKIRLAFLEDRAPTGKKILAFLTELLSTDSENGSRIFLGSWDSELRHGTSLELCFRYREDSKPPNWGRLKPTAFDCNAECQKAHFSYKVDEMRLTGKGVQVCWILKIWFETKPWNLELRWPGPPSESDEDTEVD